MPEAGHAQVFRFWKAIELFSPQKTPRLNPNSKSTPVFQLGSRWGIPWDGLVPFPAPKPEHAWRFTAYCGIFNLGRVRLALKKRFGGDTVSFDRKPDGESCLFSVQIAGDGRPLLNTFVLSSCCWAVGRLINPGPGDEAWLEGFDIAMTDAALTFAERFAVLENDEVGRALNSKAGLRVGRVIQPDELEVEVERIAQALHVAEALRPKLVHLKARQMGEKYAYEAEVDDFLNSFFLQDLGRLEQAAIQSNIGPCLSKYLAADDEVKPEDRCDVRESIEELWKNTSPSLVPAGRWLSPADQPLYFSQQFAVNSALDQFKKGSPLFGVNGPPGTGKTTLLRDVIAAVLVDRAQVLATLRSPDQAFSGAPGRWRTDRYERCIHPWRKELLGFGIVVASSNNRAVENVTLEIPAKRAIADEYIGQVDYYADFASRILPDEIEAWGLIAAPLGSKKNRRKFVNKFWYADKDRPEPRSRADRGFMTYLQEVKAAPRAWKTAVERFQKALDLVESIRAERAAACVAAETRTKSQAMLVSIEEDLKAAEEAVARVRIAVADAETLRRDRKSELEEAKRNRLEHLTYKPTLVDAVFTVGAAYREWRAKDLVLAGDVDARELTCKAVEAAYADCARDLVAAEARVAEVADRLCAQNRELAEQNTLILSLREKLGHAFPERDEWLTEPDARELSSPWTDEAWNRARTNVLMEALHLHRTFIECAPGKMKKNLTGAMDILSGKVSPNAAAEAVQSAWATLFFVVPVISTTFASFDRLFAHCGRESIGWLLIDEAGQAVPQAAAGALWRAQKAIVVGDPRQLEPIVTLPLSAQQALRAHFGVAETWLPSYSSVQTLADRASRLGTWLHSETSDWPIWVGSALRVHRRCENPMFSISNQIAYDGQMVYDTQEVAMSASPSAWINVVASESDDHWIPAEGLVLDMLLRDLFNVGVEPADILLLSPFQSVARRLREIGERRGIQHAGTIHVSQGKESEIVILVLGGDPGRSRAKEWASEKPNLLNVAVSRARRRLFIIGNRADWGQYPYFPEAASLLQQNRMVGAA